MDTLKHQVFNTVMFSCGKEKWASCVALASECIMLLVQQSLPHRGWPFMGMSIGSPIPVEQLTPCFYSMWLDLHAASEEIHCH
jgi:hypothetical protein